MNSLTDTLLAAAWLGTVGCVCVYLWFRREL